MVRAQACQIGFAQDPDGDRLTIVDENGCALAEDLTLALAVQQVLERHGRGPVVVNLSTSKCVDHVVRALGAEVMRSRIGETHVTEAMLKAGAAVGGESNGGVIIPAIHPCRDSFAGMAVILERLAQTGSTVSGLRAQIPEYHITRDKVPMRGELVPGFLRQLRQRYAGQRITLLDGVHVDFGESWVHVRRSNTEPVLRLNVETRGDRELLRRKTDELLGLIRASGATV